MEHRAVNRALFNVFASALNQGCVWILGQMEGLGAASQFQAINNILGITNPAVMGITGVQEPAVARAYVQHGARAALNSARPYIVVVGVLTVPVLALFFLVPGWTLERFYGQSSPYATLAVPLRIAAAGQLLTVAGLLAVSLLNCLRRSEIVWRIQMFTSAACLAVTIPAVLWGGLSGCIGALTLFFGFRLAALIWASL